MHVCVCIYVYVAYKFVYVFVHTCPSVHACMCNTVCNNFCACMYVQCTCRTVGRRGMYVFIHACLCVCMYLNFCMYVYLCMYS